MWHVSSSDFVPGTKYQSPVEAQFICIIPHHLLTCFNMLYIHRLLIRIFIRPSCLFFQMSPLVWTHFSPPRKTTSTNQPPQKTLPQILPRHQLRISCRKTCATCLASAPRSCFAKDSAMTATPSRPWMPWIPPAIRRCGSTPKKQLTKVRPSFHTQGKLTCKCFGIKQLLKFFEVEDSLLK